jgi:hypothetical protein
MNNTLRYDKIQIIVFVDTVAVGSAVLRASDHQSPVRVRVCVCVCVCVCVSVCVSV